MARLLCRIKDRLDSTVGMEIVKTLFYEMDSASPAGQVTLSPGVTIDRLSPSSAQDLAALSGGLNRHVIDRRFELGEACYGAYVRGRLAHYSWVKASGVQLILEAGLKYPVLPGEFWIYHCWTESWARGMRIYPSVLGRIARDYFENSFKTARIYTTLSNQTSQKGILRAGFRRTSSLRAIRMGSRYFPLKQRGSE